MEILFHIGVHGADDDRLLRSLLKNRDALVASRVAVPGPSRYRGLLRDALIGLKGEKASAASQEAMLDAILEGASADRILMSNESFISVLPKALEGGTLYPKAAEKTRRLTNLFPDHSVGFLLALRHPATFVSELGARAKDVSLETLAPMLATENLRWATMIRRITDANPDAQLLVWCSEDTPLTWNEVLRAASGVPADTKLTGGFDVLSSILTTDGMKAFRAALAETPAKTIADRRKVASRFMAEHGIREELELEIDVPGWDDTMIEELGYVYDEDIEAIRDIPNVTLIEP